MRMGLNEAWHDDLIRKAIIDRILSPTLCAGVIPNRKDAPVAYRHMARLWNIVIHRDDFFGRIDGDHSLQAPSNSKYKAFFPINFEQISYFFTIAQNTRRNVQKKCPLSLNAPKLYTPPQNRGPLFWGPRAEVKRIIFEANR